MRIVLDLQACQGANRFRGIGRYSLCLAQAISRRAAGRHEVKIALSSSFPDTVSAVRRAFAGLVEKDDLVCFHVPGPVAEHDPANIWRSRAAELIREHFLTELAPDVVHVFSLFEGWADDSVTSIGALPRSYAASATLHGLIPLLYRDTYLTNERRRGQYYRKLNCLKNADLLLAVSDSSRREALSELGLSEDLLTTVYPSADPIFGVREISRDREAALRNRHGIVKPFIFTVGGWDPRKKLAALVEAYARFPENVRRAYQLVIAGDFPSPAVERLSFLSERLGLSDRDLVMTGGITDEDLVAFYNLCELFVFPSLHEGFGSPIVEAMACGAAVMGSNVASVPEVIGREDATFDPTDVDAMAHAMIKGLTDTGFKDSLKTYGLSRAREFSWDNSADKALDAFEALYERRSAMRPNPGSCWMTGPYKPKLAFVSPLPPEHSGVSDYSADLIPELARFYDMELIADQTTLDDPLIEANFPIRDIAWFRDNAHRFERILYQFGNSPCHKHMFGLLQQFPGVVTLHDFFLGNVPAWMEMARFEQEAFRKALYESHGYHALLDLTRDGTEATCIRYPCNKIVIDHATSVIAHSRYALREAERWYGPNTAQEWHLIPQIRNATPRFDRTEARRRLGIREDIFLVCSFGFLGPFKLNHRLLEAWLNSPQAEDERCRLIFVGENSDDSYQRGLVERIKAAGREDRVRITGWVSQDEFRMYLAAADCAVQLRTSSRGENSRVVLDALYHSLSTIVNANGSLAEYPDDVLIKLTDNFDEAELIEALEKVRQDESLRVRLGISGRAYISDNHAPKKIGILYRDAIEWAATGSPHARYCGLLKSLARISVPVQPSDEDLFAAAEDITANVPREGDKKLLVDVTACRHFDPRTGIQRVVRALTLSLLRKPPHGMRVEPVYLEAGLCRYATDYSQDLLGLEKTTIVESNVEVQPGDLFLGLDLNPHGMDYCKGLLKRYRMEGVGIYAVLYDLLPLTHSSLFPPGTEQWFRSWLENLMEVADGLIGISRASAEELLKILNQGGVSRPEPMKIGFFHLGGNITDSVPSKGMPEDAVSTLQCLQKSPSFIMVGTVEPRKCHAQVFGAFELLWTQGVPANLVIVGNEGWKVESLEKSIRRCPEFGKRLFRLQGVSDEYLEKLYSSCTALIAASENEGFGLPLIEAAQHGLPIIARDLPVFREVAGEHAFYFNGTEDAALASAVRTWLELNAEGRAPSSKGLPWLSWEQSAEMLTRVIVEDNWFTSWHPSDHASSAAAGKP